MSSGVAGEAVSLPAFSGGFAVGGGFLEELAQGLHVGIRPTGDPLEEIERVQYGDDVEPIRAEVIDDKQRRDTRGRRIVAAERRAELLTAYEASGLTQSAFARREGINFHTFVAWLGQRRKAGAAAAAAPVSFREVCLPQMGRTVPMLEVMLPGGLTVRGSSATAVAELVRALRA